MMDAQTALVSPGSTPPSPPAPPRPSSPSLPIVVIDGSVETAHGSKFLLLCIFQAEVSACILCSSLRLPFDGCYRYATTHPAIGFDSGCQKRFVVGPADDERAGGDGGGGEGGGGGGGGEEGE